MNKTRFWNFNLALIFSLFIFSNSNLISQNIYCEANDILVVELESESTVSNWFLQTNIAGYSGTGYFYWNGPNYYTAPGNGLLTYTIKIDNPGTYRFRWKSYIAMGTKQSEHNDAWLRIPDADDFYGYKASSNSTVYPKGSGKTPNPNGQGSNGWFKVYMNNLNAWSWNANTSDQNAHQIYAVFNNPGLYTVEISGRSEGFAIDKFVLYKESSWNLFNVQNAAASTINCNLYYQDSDNDGYGNPAITSSSPQAGYITTAGDCDDTNPAVNPGAFEICGNTVDENCDGITTQSVTWYEDYDNDGFGNPSVSQSVCSQPAGYVADNTDCLDSLASAFPGANEVPGDGLDNNCNGQIDETGIISAVRLINASNETFIQTINDGDIIGLNGLPSGDLNIDVTTNQAVGGIVFTMTGAENENANENVAPYALFGDAGGNYNNWNPTLGVYSLTVDAYSGTNGSGTLLGSITVNFTIQQASASFPVEWLDFQAKQIDHQVKLEWQTASEQNSSHFVIERRNASESFQEIGQVGAAGNSDEISFYEMIDPNPKTGLVNYRIKQVDYDGQFSYSSIVEISVEAMEILQIYPNPVISNHPLYLRGILPQITEVNLNLISSTGKLVWQKEHFTLSNEGTALDLPRLPAGMYFLRIQNEKEIQVLKLIIRS